MLTKKDWKKELSRNDIDSNASANNLFDKFQTLDAVQQEMALKELSNYVDEIESNFLKSKKKAS